MMQMKEIMGYYRTEYDLNQCRVEYVDVHNAVNEFLLNEGIKDYNIKFNDSRNSAIIVYSKTSKI